MSNKLPFTLYRVLLVVFASLALAACGNGAVEEGAITVSDVWGRPSPMSAANAAFYMNIHNNGPEADRLIDAASDACRHIELHESKMDDAGMMRMEHIMEIELPAGQTVALQVGGLHVMCLDRQVDLLPGETIELELHFANAGVIPVEVEIREE